MRASSPRLSLPAPPAAADCACCCCWGCSADGVSLEPPLAGSSITVRITAMVSALLCELLGVSAPAVGAPKVAPASILPSHEGKEAGMNKGWLETVGAGEARPGAQGIYLLPPIPKSSQVHQRTATHDPSMEKLRRRCAAVWMTKPGLTGHTGML